MLTCITKEPLLTSVTISWMARELTGIIGKDVPPFGTRIFEIGVASMFPGLLVVAEFKSDRGPRHPMLGARYIAFGPFRHSP